MSSIVAASLGINNVVGSGGVSLLVQYVVDIYRAEVLASCTDPPKSPLEKNDSRKPL